MASRVATGLAAVAAIAVLAAWVGGQPAQAKDWPGGYDPASGWTWDQDFRYDPVMNPFGFREPESSRPYYSRQSVYYPGYPYAATSANYYDSAPAYGFMPSANYAYGAYAPAPANTARIRLVVPADARVWFDNKATTQSGAMRNFESPALMPGHQYGYDVKAQWRDKDGKEVTRTRHVDVSANSDVRVDLTRQ
jgi:uncharacterized protein (TIGR03000 family)